MKREIKFRGKTEDGEWVYGFYTKTHFNRSKMGENGFEDSIVIFNGGSTKPIPVISTTIGQFTGLFDKYDKEIYEGDIIKWHNYYPPKRIDWFICQFDAGNGESSMPLIDIKLRFNIEVIGNIHDNPELI